MGDNVHPSVEPPTCTVHVLLVKAVASAGNSFKNAASAGTGDEDDADHD